MDSLKDNPLLVMLSFFRNCKDTPMPAAHSVPLIPISTLIGLLFGLMVWGFWRAKRREVDNTLPGSHGDVLLGLLEVTLTILRDGKQIEVPVTLSERLALAALVN
jgi:hypothetical protein